MIIKKAFTLIELIIVMAILAILISVVATAVDAPRSFAKTNDVQRISDIRNILNAIHEYTIDHKGILPPGLSINEQQLGNSVSGCVNLNRGCNVTNNICLDLSTTLADYFKTIPKDPVNGSSAKTNYSVSINSKNIVTIKACGAQGIEELSVSM